MQIRGDIEFRRIPAAFGASGNLPVDCDFQKRIRTLKAKDHLFSLPRSRQIEFPPVNGQRIAVMGHPGRIRRERILDIGVDRDAVSGQLRVGRYFQPVRQFQFGKTVDQVGAGITPELPGPVQTEFFRIIPVGMGHQ